KIRTVRALLGVVAAFGPAPALADQSCHLTMIASLPIDTATPNRVMIDAVLDDSPVKMIVDTGAIQTFISESAAERFKLRRQGIPESLGIRDYMGNPVKSVAVIPSLQTGNLHSTNVHALIMPRDFQPPAIGLLGPDLLSHYEVELDFASNNLNLFSQDHCQGQVVYWTHDPVAVVPLRLDRFGHLRLDVELDGKQIDAGLDTGAPGSAMKLRNAEADFGLTRQSLGMTENQPYAFHTFKSLSFGGIAVSNPKVFLSGGTGRLGEELKSPFLIGLAEMRQLHLMISYKEKTLYATAAGAH